MAKSLRSNYSINSIYLSTLYKKYHIDRNKIDDEGAIAIAKLLKINDVIKLIDLSNIKSII